MKAEPLLKRTLPAVLLLGGLLSISCAPGEADRATRQQWILGGEPDLADQYPQVMTSGHQSLLCSAALIAPDLVLTAHHCVSRPETMVTAVCDPDVTVNGTSDATLMFPVLDKAEVLVGRGLTDTGKYLMVAALHHRPEWQSAQMCGNDLTVVQLADPIQDIAPLPLRLWLPPQVGEPLTVVGYGVDDPASSFSSGKRRFREDVAVAAVGRVKKDAATWRTVDSEFIITEGACAGDSGGPALDGAGAVTGVMSRGRKSTCQEMIYGQLPEQAQWLGELVVQSFGRTGQPPPAWTSRPDPASASLGETCGSADHCALPYDCRPIQGQHLCVVMDCLKCPGGWTCSADDTATEVCGTAPPTPDSGTPADLGAPADAGESKDAGPGADVTGVAPAEDGGCTILPDTEHGLPLGVLGYLLLWLVVRRRRCVQRGRFVA